MTALLGALQCGMSNAALPADAVIVARLRDRDEAMFAMLLDACSPGLLRAARAYVRDEHAAQDVVQETWLGVVRGIGAFEARSSLRTRAEPHPRDPRPVAGRLSGLAG